MNVAKAQLRKDIRQRKEKEKEQNELCGPRLAHKIEKMLFEYKKNVGLADDMGNIIDKTTTEMKMIATGADSTAFMQAQNKNDNKD